MTTPPSIEHKKRTGRLHKVPFTTWVGIGITALLALIVLTGSGVWSMLAAIAFVVLMTAVYGLILRRRTWLRLPRTRTAAMLGAVVAAVVLLGSAAANGAAHPITTVRSPSSEVHVATTSPTPVSPAPTRAPEKKQTPTPTPVITTKVVTTTTPIPFPSRTVESATLPKGASSITTHGTNGVETKTYVVTYSNGVETGRTLQRDTVTTPPVTQVTTVGTHIVRAAPTCTNGTYVNSAGNTVCRPETSSNVPNGATAKCFDGTYSFSQSRRGTCSHHGGVADWL